MDEQFQTKTTYREIASDWREAARAYTHHWEFWLILSLGNMLVIVADIYRDDFTADFPLLNGAALLVALYVFCKEWGGYNA